MKMRGILLGLALAVSTVAGAQPPPPTVMVQSVVQLASAPTLPVTGTIHSRQELQVTAGVDGRLAFVAEPGARVKRGEPIARIDTGTLELRHAELHAQAERARAQLRFLDAQLARQQGLADSRVLSANDLEQTRSQRDMAASDLRIAEVRLLQVADDIARATVSADFDGIVTERLRRAGEDVGRGTVLARIIDTDELEVRVLTPLQHQGRIAEGDRLRVHAFGREAFARVRGVVPLPDPRRQALELYLDLPSAAGGQAWTVGELVSVELPLLAPAGAVAVPQDALVLRQDGIYVFRVGEDSTAERVKVDVGDSHDGYVAVGSALSAGDQVVVRGGESLAPGQRVNVLGAAPG